MKAMDIVMDLRIWVISAIALSLIVESLSMPSSFLIIIVLMVQMTFSMDGMKLSIQRLKEYRRDAMLSILLTYGINTLVTLAIGALFIQTNEPIWYGWVILASMPCAVGVVMAAVLTKENVEIAFVGVTAAYVLGIAITPLLSFMLIGDAIDPFEILKYLALFIVIPLIVSRPLSKFGLSRNVKVPVINAMMFIMIFLSVNSNRGYLLNDPMFILIILLVTIARVLILNTVSRMFVRISRMPDDRVTIQTVMGVWKNTGLSISICMLLLETTESVIPCFLSMMVECIWFSLITRKDADHNTV